MEIYRLSVKYDNEVVEIFMKIMKLELKIMIRVLIQKEFYVE